jgi:cbb3-type cytochrome oxidase subunit 1
LPLVLAGVSQPLEWAEFPLVVDASVILALALAIIYFVIPASMRRPVYSHFLSMLGFWLLFFLYPLNGTHHYVFSVIPMAAQIGAIAASTLLGVTVVIVVTNLFLSMRGAGWVARDPGLRFVATSTLFYLVVSIQGASQAQMAVQQAVHFTDWVIGHSHMAMLGFASFAAAGGLVHAWQRLPSARYNARAIRWSYWLLVTGMLIMFVDLNVAGIVQGRMWQSPLPWIDSIVATRPFWLVRVVSGVVLFAGFISLLLGLTTGPIGAGLRELEDGRGAEPAEEVSPRLTAAAAMEASS